MLFSGQCIACPPASVEPMRIWFVVAVVARVVQVQPGRLLRVAGVVVLRADGLPHLLHLRRLGVLVAECFRAPAWRIAHVDQSWYLVLAWHERVVLLQELLARFVMD